MQCIQVSTASADALGRLAVLSELWRLSLGRPKIHTVSDLRQYRLTPYVFCASLHRKCTTGDGTDQAQDLTPITCTGRRDCAGLRP